MRELYIVHIRFSKWDDDATGEFSESPVHLTPEEVRGGYFKRHVKEMILDSLNNVAEVWITKGDKEIARKKY